MAQAPGSAQHLLSLLPATGHAEVHRDALALCCYMIRRRVDIVSVNRCGLDHPDRRSRGEQGKSPAPAACRNLSTMARDTSDALEVTAAFDTLPGAVVVCDKMELARASLLPQCLRHNNLTTWRFKHLNVPV